MTELNEMIKKLSKILFSHGNAISAGVEKERCKLRIILNDEEEYGRLLDMIDAKKNRYGYEGEELVLKSLNSILLSGVATKQLTTPEMILALKTLLEAGFQKGRFENEC